MSAEFQASATRRDLERHVLGAMLVSEGQIQSVLDTGLTVEHFDYRERHGFVYEAILELHGEKKAVDAILVADRLEERGRLKRVGGKDRLIELGVECPVPGHASNYAEAVKAKAAEGPQEAADGSADLLTEISTFIRRFVVLPVPLKDQDVVGDLLALWVLHTHTFEASWATPYLRITSAAPDSGKTLLLEVLAAISRGGWHAVNPSSAILYRKVDRDQPTLLLDEMDNYPMEDRKDALSVLNSGYKRGAKVPRCNERGDLLEFEVYCPKAYAGLDARQLVPALLSRSITIRMETKLSSEKVDPWIAPLVEADIEALHARCEDWAEQHLEALRDAQPDLVGLVNRKAEVWWALLAIGELVGGEWQDRARAAARALTAGGDDVDALSNQEQLLRDIRDGFGDGKTIFTAELLAYLNAQEESPWGARRKGEGVDARGLATMLRPFKIKPRTVRIDDETAKGYHAAQFEDAFARYLGPSTAVTSVTSVTNQPQSQAVVTDVTDVTDAEGASDGSGNHHLTEDEYAARWRARQGKAGS